MKPKLFLKQHGESLLLYEDTEGNPVSYSPGMDVSDYIGRFLNAQDAINEFGARYDLDIFKEPPPPEITDQNIPQPIEKPADSLKLFYEFRTQFHKYKITHNNKEKEKLKHFINGMFNIALLAYPQLKEDLILLRETVLNGDNVEMKIL